MPCVQRSSAPARAEVCSQDGRGNGPVYDQLGVEDHAVADGAAPVGKGVSGNAEAGSKRDRVLAVEQEKERRKTCNKKLPMTLFSHTQII